MELAAAMVSSEVEKNVQMQALSKFKATITKVSYMIEFCFGEGKGYLFKYSYGGGVEGASAQGLLLEVDMSKSDFYFYCQLKYFFVCCILSANLFHNNVAFVDQYRLSRKKPSVHTGRNDSEAAL